jgi:tetratricopeptide (TPR) repeat protein
LALVDGAASPCRSASTTQELTMPPVPPSRRRRVAVAVAACGLAVGTFALTRSAASGNDAFDPLLSDPGGVCGPATGGQPAVLRQLILAAVKTETAPFTPQPMKAAEGDPPLYANLGSLAFPVTTKSPRAQSFVSQGVRLSFAFNHAEAQRAFRAAQKLDPESAMGWWGEALILGPNINVPMMPEANEPALAALSKAVALKDKATPRERALIEALEKRYSADPKADRAALDGAYADAMAAVAARYPDDLTIATLAVEAAMDTQPWDYWEAGGAKPKGRGATIVGTLESVLKRAPSHPGAIHLYIHAVEASTTPERALPYANRLGALMPGAGHIVHMPAHIYYRVGMYRESLAVNRKAIAVDESYFRTSPSDPLYKSAYYPHNIHFVMVSAQIGGDGKTAVEAAGKLDAAIPMEIVKAFAIMQPIKAAPYTTHAQFSDPDTILALPAPPPDLAVVTTMYHYARAVAYAGRKDAAGARKEIDALAALEASTDFQPFAEWGLPAKEIMQVARHVAAARLADAQGDLAKAAAEYDEAIFVEDTLPYTEPPHWYYPVRQSLAGVLLRQGKLDEAERTFRESLARTRNNGWALAGLAEVYKRKGDAKAAQAARAAYANTWTGPARGPDLARL